MASENGSIGIHIYLRKLNEKGNNPVNFFIFMFILAIYVKFALLGIFSQTLKFQ